MNKCLASFVLLFLHGTLLAQQGVSAGNSPHSYFRNPILKGFNPDPDILRVGEDYYITTTTFEWFPGIPVYHSRDLVHWQLLTHVLTKKSQLQLEGIPNSGGLYIASLTYHKGVFYCVYSIVKTIDWPLMSISNYIVTAKSILGPWSLPTYLHSEGFDPKLVFDKDGKSYIINMILDYTAASGMGGIQLQEYSLASHLFMGKPVKILEGTGRGGPEGPELYYVNGYYYLLCADAGTSWNHESILARSKNIWGPYEMAPNNPILTSKNTDGPLQKAGQGGLVQTQNNEWYMVHHGGRPLPAEAGVKERKVWSGGKLVDLEGGGHCPLGRETCLEKVKWTENGWLELAGGGNHPFEKVQLPNLKLHPFPAENYSDDFDRKRLNKFFYFLRNPPAKSWLNLEKQKGYLTMRGRKPLSSLFEQSMVAQKWKSFHFTAETGLKFEPDNYMQMAGLICFYDTKDFVYLNISRDKTKGRCLSVLERTGGGGTKEMLPEKISLPDKKEVFLKVAVDDNNIIFSYSMEKKVWQKINCVFKAKHLSDEGVNGDQLRFTGAMVGICVQDMMYEQKPAAFDYFHYNDLK